jgi:hypothetical protein
MLGGSAAVREGSHSFCAGQRDEVHTEGVLSVYLELLPLPVSLLPKLTSLIAEQGLSTRLP